MMTSFPALDVALGLAFVFFLLSVLVTALTEAVAWLTRQRSKQLEAWLVSAFARRDGSRTPTDLLAEFKASPAYTTLRLSSGGNPSYIPSSHFMDGISQTIEPVEGAAEPTVRSAVEVWGAVGTGLERFKGSAVGDALIGLHRRANGDASSFRADAEAWFDDQMERLSGDYRRWAQRINAGLGVALIVALNANAIRIAQILWSDPASRAAVVAGAGAPSRPTTADDAIARLQALPLPLGWSGGWAYHGVAQNVYALLGAFLALAAVSLGAPFWFDALSTVARIRTTGAPPPASGAVRRGEGDQRRAPST